MSGYNSEQMKYIESMDFKLDDCHEAALEIIGNLDYDNRKLRAERDAAYEKGFEDGLNCDGSDFVIPQSKNVKRYKLVEIEESEAGDE